MFTSWNFNRKRERKRFAWKKDERYASRGKWCFECDSPFSEIADKIAKSKESIRFAEMCCTLRVESDISNATRLYRKSLTRLHKWGKFAVYGKEERYASREKWDLDLNPVKQKRQNCFKEKNRLFGKKQINAWSETNWFNPKGRNASRGNWDWRTLARKQMNGWQHIANYKRLIINENKL